MVPAVALAYPGELLATLQPGDAIHYLNPGRVPLGEHGPDGAGAGVAQYHLVRVLHPVEPLQEDLIRPGGPIHPGDVVLAGVSLDGEPPGRPAGCGHDPDSRRRVLLADL